MSDGYATFLTCSMDRNLKLCDSRNMQTAQSIYVGEPVWNCCWNASHSQFVYVGTQAGKVRMYDLRMICNQQGNEPLRDISNMQKPVVSLHWKHHPSRPESRQGLMASTVSDCELNLWSASDNSFRCHNIFFNVQSGSLTVGRSNSVESKLFIYNYDEHSQSSTFAAIYDEESQKIQLWDMNTNRKCCQSDNAHVSAKVSS
ncbi:E3 ubiquitin-protein ligase [Trichinella spiralis]|uniref:RING-type E3 ubiquitin transferase n=1 Tax=Trichinella spiralis TaxID=6334 RepID=A0ABR3KNJ4_TRISP